MPRSYGLRLAASVLANALLPVAVLIFASGFFPYKPFLPGLATFADVSEAGEDAVAQPPAIFDRVVFMVVDALRSDFVYGHESGFEFTQSLIRSGAAVPFTAHATPPTVTMPRVKALTTGSVPSFLDLILNFAESDTSSSLAAQDTWLAQLRARRPAAGRIVFYGDDTWLKLFPDPDFFARVDGTSSFFVSDFTEVDLNVTRHVLPELAHQPRHTSHDNRNSNDGDDENTDWAAMVLHYLGLDHIGHKTGPQGPNMLPKQREMDAIVRSIYDAMLTLPHHRDTLLVLAGDHGMNAGGNHGGSGPGETEPALLFASPKLQALRGAAAAFECPTRPRPGTEFHYYSKVQQSDLVPTLAGLMGLPVSRNSLGVFIPEFTGLWSAQDALVLLRQNARQILRIVEATFGGADAFRAVVDGYARGKLHASGCDAAPEGQQRLACLWAAAEASSSQLDLEAAKASVVEFLLEAQDLLSGTASSYNLSRMGLGMGIATVIVALSLVSLPTLWPPSTAGVFFVVMSILYGVMMFASSYVEEEQHFWYWLAPAWIVLLSCERAVNRHAGASRVRILAAAVILLFVHRLAVRWNQTGQKHAGEPDIVHAFFPDAHVVMWLLILAAYSYNGLSLVRKTFAGLLSLEASVLSAVVLVLPAIVFKINFTQADAPELVQGLALQIRELSATFDLVLQARVAFIVLAFASISVVALAVSSARASANAAMEETGLLPSLAERLHHLLTLFLMTQTRAPNVPLLLGMEIQRRQLAYLERSTGPSRSVLPVATTVLLLSHVYFFCMGGSNSISSIDLSNAYNGVADYNIVAVGVLLFASNWCAPVWWCSAANLLLNDKQPVRGQPSKKPQANGDRSWIEQERTKLHSDTMRIIQTGTKAPTADGSNGTWMTYISVMTAFMSTGLVAVMAACTALRTHLFIWTVFSPKYLYSMAWSVLWQLMINAGLGNLLSWMSRIS